MSNSYSEIFRPKKVEQLIGDSQRAVAKSLLEKVQSGNILQEVLFTGPSGVGKTTIARIYVQAILGEGSNIDEHIQLINCGANTGIDNIRTVIDRMQYLPLDCDYTILFLDEIHGLTKDAQRALLTEIEPLPSHVIMIGATTDPDKIIPTLRSRFTEYNLSIPSISEFRKLAGWIRKSVIKNNDHQLELYVSFTEDEIEKVISGCRGNVRQFDRDIQKLIDGSYTSAAPEDQDSLFDLIFRGSSSLNEWFKEASKQASYTGTAVSLCNYAISVISNGNSSNIGSRSILVLKIFGQGLSPYSPEKNSFYAKLVELHQQINGR